jgi:hypothetical protein
MRSPRNAALLLREHLAHVGAGLAVIVAAIHLFHPQHGLPRLVLLVGTGNASLLVTDPRPLAFVLSGIALLVGVQLAVAGVARKRLAVLGMALVATYFVGYFAWHLTGHGGFLPGREPLHHGLHPVQAVIIHLGTSPVAAVSKVAEGLLFVVLLRRSRREP